jgi:hypothetical protein
VCVRLNECVLRDGVGLDFIADDGVGHAVDLALETIDEKSERRRRRRGFGRSIHCRTGRWR